MSRHLMVLLGAGASHDCASVHVTRREEMRPPLVRGLFDSRFNGVLESYPLAQAAAAEIRREVDGDALPLEAFLRERLRDSTHPTDRRIYTGVPPYLQDLFFRISRPGAFTDHADNYSRLVSATLRLDEVIFVTLNYDTLLDQQLEPHDRSHRDMQWYIRPGRGWSLIKLHGSVDWGRRVLDAAPDDPRAGFTRGEVLRGDVSVADVNRQFEELADDLHSRLSYDPVYRPGRDLGAVRLGESDYEAYYPALSAPLGSQDEIVCPRDHSHFLRSWMFGRGRLNLLVIGYSGADQEVIRILADGELPIGRLKIVQPEFETGWALAQKLATRLRWGADAVASTDVFGGSFNDFVQGPDLREFIGALPDGDD